MSRRIGPNSVLPLVERAEDAALFLRDGGAVGCSAFLGDVQALAAGLSPAGAVINLCRDRYRFAVAFAASVVRGRVCLLPGDASGLAGLATRYPGAEAVADARVVTGNGRGENFAIPGDRVAAVAFTSGSTGEPVGHPKLWGELVARSRAAGVRFGFGEEAPVSVVGTVPPGHMYGLETTVLLPLHAACASWCGAWFFPGDVAAALAAVLAVSGGRRVLVTTPLQLRALAEVAATGLAAVISATAPLDAGLAAEAEARWGAPVLEIFGATECGSIASRRTVEGEWWVPYPGLCVRQDERGASVAGGGMAAVGLADELEMAADGRFRLLGRRADLVKLGGRRASLAGLNRILVGLEGVRDGIFVVPEDLERRSTARLLAVVVAPERSGPSILAELRGRMDPVFVPRRVVHVEALPRNAMGKLKRQAVLDLLAGKA